MLVIIFFKCNGRIMLTSHCILVLNCHLLLYLMSLFFLFWAFDLASYVLQIIMLFLLMQILTFQLWLNVALRHSNL